MERVCLVSTSANGLRRKQSSRSLWEVRLLLLDRGETFDEEPADTCEEAVIESITLKSWEWLNQARTKRFG
jgi:hypothetical protein